MSSMDSADCETEEDSSEACVSPEGPLLPSNSREMRNRAEKMRRDKLNSFITELASLVPMISRSSKRMDKTSILRLTASHLRIYQTLLSDSVHTQSMKIPQNIDQFTLEQLVCDQLGGFLIILSSTGKIIFVSHTVETLLGHLQTDLLGQSIFNLTQPEDHDRLRMYLNTDNFSDSDWRKYFSIRLKRAGPRTESAVYETVSMMGMQRPIGVPKITGVSTSKDLVPATPINQDLWVFFVRVARQEPLTHTLMEGNKDEYVTRHLVDGRIIGCDQRISFVAGYLIEEVTGLSAFKFMHREDVRWVMIALRQMYDKGESRGSSCYRLLSRTGQFIYLKTCGFLEIDNKGTVESFICVNTLVDEREGLRMIKDMKHKYSALIQGANPVTNSTQSTQWVEDPDKLEQAIAHLINNLPSPGPESGESSGEEEEDCSQKNHQKTATKRSLGTDSDSSNKRHKECECNNSSDYSYPVVVHNIPANSENR